jgi:hypothetical protein
MGLGPTEPPQAAPRADTPDRAAVLAVLADPAAWAAILMTGCPRCGGDGVIQEPQWAAWWADEMGLREAWKLAHPGGDWHSSPEHAEHETVMPETDAEQIDCPQCRGAAHLPTPAGQALMRFVRAHLR